jgi:predicted negative regulator of RcsB-dependent stress response
LATYETDEEQLEAIKKWWKENGRSVIAGVVIGLGAILGWRGWQWYETNRAEAASALYERAMDALEAKQFAAVNEAAEELKTDYDDTAYAGLGMLAAAWGAVEQDDLAVAQRRLSWAAENAQQEGVRYIARIRLARVLTAAEDYDAALKALDSELPPSYRGLGEEIKGDVYVARGETALAKTAYRNALNAPTGPADRATLEMKLNDLGVGKPGEPPP